MDPEKTLENIFATVNSLHEIAKSEEAVASLAKQMKESLKQLDAEWKATRDAELKKKDEAEAKLTDLYAQVDKMSKTLTEAQTKLWEMEENSRATKRLIAYNARMEAMDATYDMDEDDRKLMASKLEALDETDESFAKFQEEWARVWKHKNKEVIAKAKADAEAEIATRLAEIAKAGKVASGEEKKATEDALENAKASQEGVINNNKDVSNSETFIDKWKKSFDPKKSLIVSQ